MDFGPLFITAGIAQAARDDVGFLSEILECLRRYQLGDWGDLCTEDMPVSYTHLCTTGERFTTSATAGTGAFTATLPGISSRSATKSHSA